MLEEPVGRDNGSGGTAPVATMHEDLLPPSDLGKWRVKTRGRGGDTTSDSFVRVYLVGMFRCSMEGGWDGLSFSQSPLLAFSSVRH